MARSPNVRDVSLTNETGTYLARKYSLALIFGGPRHVFSADILCVYLKGYMQAAGHLNDSQPTMCTGYGGQTLKLVPQKAKQRLLSRAAAWWAFPRPAATGSPPFVS
uniref:Uncharacterized protein n=1 Tax=Coccidioides posadasii RMSCC 3488 TaxID=454284 RepID=A0A0J6FUV8_COCPO|nr:hypothetical protein CPAG_09489 [Coccidioides posadasii RMSCC 3488]